MTNYFKQGTDLRRTKPIAWIATWAPAKDRDPLAIINRVAEGRDPKLVATRNQEMGSSAFSFLRGAAAVMAADLSPSLQDTTGIELVICGDAHLGNFGAYFSPERTPVFDLNDFDEARLGPWEWDVCRLAASIAVAGGKLQRGGKGDSVTPAVEAYTDALKRILAGPLVGRYYGLERVAAGVSTTGKPKFSGVEHAFQPLFANLHVHTQEETVAELIKGGGRGSKFRSHAEVDPVQTHVSHQVTAAYWTYLDTVATGLERLLDGYSPTSVALRPVGEGSLGLRDYLLLTTGHGQDDRLILQVKEATRRP